MESDNNDVNESLYTDSGVSSVASCITSSEGSLQSADCCCDGSDHCKEVDSDYWERTGFPASELLYRRLFGTRQRDVTVSSGERIQTQSSWTSPLRRISVLLAACSLSSLAACIATTDFRMSLIKAHVRTESLLQPPLADSLSSHWNSAAKYSWDCVALAGRAQCSPVEKSRSLRKGSLSSVKKHRQSVEAFRVLVDGLYHVSVQITGTAWQAPPPTLLRVVVARVIAKSGHANMTSIHSFTGTGGDSEALAVAAHKGTFSVYTAVSVRLNAGEQLLAHVVCVEKPDCVVHVNGTVSYLTLERLD